VARGHSSSVFNSGRCPGIEGLRMPLGCHVRARWQAPYRGSGAQPNTASRAACDRVSGNSAGRLREGPQTKRQRTSPRKARQDMRSDGLICTTRVDRPCIRLAYHFRPTIPTWCKHAATPTANPSRPPNTCGASSLMAPTAITRRSDRRIGHGLGSTGGIVVLDLGRSHRGSLR